MLIRTGSMEKGCQKMELTHHTVSETGVFQTQDAAAVFRRLFVFAGVILAPAAFLRQGAAERQMGSGMGLLVFQCCPACFCQLVPAGSRF